MDNESERLETEEQFIQQLINETKTLVQRNGEPFGEKHPFKMVGYDVDPKKFSPSDPILKPRFSGPIRQVRVLLSEREDGSVQIQAHAQFPSETRVVSLELSNKETPKMSEYKAFSPEATPPYTTPIPITEEITTQTLQAFMDLVSRAKLGK